jgi:hypothetical protein
MRKTVPYALKPTLIRGTLSELRAAASGVSTTFDFVSR